METLISKVAIGLIGASSISLVWGIIHLFGNKTEDAESQERIITEKEDGFGKPGKRWTQKDYRFLINHSDLSDQTLANALNRSTGAISAKRSELELQNNGHKSGEEAIKELEKVEEKAGLSGKIKSKENSVDEILEERKESIVDAIMEYIDLSIRPPSSRVTNILTPRDVIEIYISNFGKEHLANKFDVSKSTIDDINNKRYWDWLTNQIDQYNRFEGRKSNNNRKLTEKEVKEIYRKIKNGESNREIAKDFPCTRQNIVHIRNKKTWSDVTNQLDKRIDYQRPFIL